MAGAAVFLGDSITDCDRLWDVRPDGLGFGYVRKIKEGLPAGEALRLYNRGHNGFTAFQVRERLAEDLSGIAPHTATLQVGINDLAGHLYGGGYGAEGFGKELCRILEALKDRGIHRLILLEPFVFPVPAMYRTWEESLSLFAKEARAAARQCRAAFVPLWELFKKAMEDCPPEALTTDGIHLTERGHELAAKAWLEEYGRTAK